MQERPGTRATGDPLTAPWDPLQIGVMRALHRWTLSNTAVDHLLVQWMGLPTSEASALSHVVWDAEAGTPLSPGELARRMAMTTGATTLLVDRLEAAGHVRRSREHADRRRVTLRPTGEARERVRAFLGAAGVEVADALHGADPRDLETVTAFLDLLDRANRTAVVRLGETSPT